MWGTVPTVCWGLCQLWEVFCCVFSLLLAPKLPSPYPTPHFLPYRQAEGQALTPVSFPTKLVHHSWGVPTAEDGFVIYQKAGPPERILSTHAPDKRSMWGPRVALRDANMRPCACPPPGPRFYMYPAVGKLLSDVPGAQLLLTTEHAAIRLSEVG